MAHEADKWIESQWLNKQVVQVKGSDDCIGREGKVIETFWDEKGALHCKVDDWWCPAAFLAVQE